MKKTAGKRRVRRRKKLVFSDTVRAAVLAGIIIAVAAFISAVFIVVHSTVKEISQKAGKSRPAITYIPEFPAPETALPPVSERAAETLPENTASPKPAAPPEKKDIPARDVSPRAPAAVPAKPSEKPAPPMRPENAPQARPAAPPQRPEQPRRSGTVVIVIDDAGNNLAELEPFLRFPGPLTIAVLPGLPHSAEAARRIRAAGKEVFLHQPMEALGGQNPGPGAINADMSKQEVRDILARNLAEIGPVAGMNNHQGSKITSDQRAMETVLEFCREQGFPYLDSRTTADTVVPVVARRLNVKIGERNTFIDNDSEKTAMSKAINGGLDRAFKQGSDVMIGHAWSPELAGLLTELYPSLIEQGYTLASASAYLMGVKN